MLLHLHYLDLHKVEEGGPFWICLWGLFGRFFFSNLYNIDIESVCLFIGHLFLLNVYCMQLKLFSSVSLSALKVKFPYLPLF